MIITFMIAFLQKSLGPLKLDFFIIYSNLKMSRKHILRSFCEYYPINVLLTLLHTSYQLLMVYLKLDFWTKFLLQEQ